MDKNWARVYTSTVLYNVELLRNILHEKSIEAVVVNRQDSFYPSIGDIQLYVKREMVIQAKKIIEDSNL